MFRATDKRRANSLVFGISFICGKTLKQRIPNYHHHSLLQSATTRAAQHSGFRTKSSSFNGAIKSNQTLIIMHSLFIFESKTHPLIRLGLLVLASKES